MSTSKEEAVKARPADDESVPDYTAEIRFGVVMYGGVSLAIYINGVTNELYEMACATPRDGVRIGDPPGSVTREMYRRVSWLAGNAELRRRYAAAIEASRTRAGDPKRLAEDVWPSIDLRGATRTRLAIDVIAGTSAGGINGVFLAKALANGESFSALKDLWVDEGDIGLLLNDEASYSGTQPPIANRSAHPASLLNSDRMYAKLLYAMQRMQPLAGVTGLLEPGDSPLAEEIDLFVTTTDIRGSAVPLRLFDKVVYERRYKQHYHFRYPDGHTVGGNDFVPDNMPFLAFASRCTSSFPFAFEPMTLDVLTRLKVAGDAPGVLRWNAFFPNLPRDEIAQGQHVYRAFGDGGYLDNKPFTYVVETLSRRFAAVPMERKLLYVEPSPEQLDAQGGAPQLDEKDLPDALENSLAALLTIPRYETIREDLQSVLARNRRIERIERVVMLGERSIEALINNNFNDVVLKEGEVPAWQTLKLSDMVRYYGTAFLPYQRLRVYTVGDAIADGLAERWSIGQDSDNLYALRALARAWRDQHFDEEALGDLPTLNAFLNQFDFDYRIRRLGFLLRKVDKMTRLFHRRASGELLELPQLSDEEAQLLKVLPEPFRSLGEEADLDVVRHGEAILRTLKAGLLECRERLQDARRLRAAAHAEADEGQGQQRGQLLAALAGILARAPGSEVATAMRPLQDQMNSRADEWLKTRPQGDPLLARLERDIESMRIARASSTTDAPPPGSLSAAATLAWALLGRPELVVDTKHQSVDIDIKDAGTAGLTRISAAGLARLNTPEGRALRLLLGRYYLRYDSYDQMSFPLYYDTGTGEPSTVEVLRISPVDATHLINESQTPQRRKLAGTALANFGAFLDRRWRLNDIMWGRLDGAERLVQVLLPMADSALLRDELIERAQRSILKDALTVEGQAMLTGLFVDALAEMPANGTPAEQLREMLARLWNGDSVARDRLGTMLASLLDEAGLMDYVRSTRQVDPEPDPKTTLASAARAVTITGRILEGISKKHGGGKAVPRWLARLGLLLQGIVAVSLPGTLAQRWWTHGVKVLYAFELTLVLLAFLFGSADMRTLAITALASTIGIHLLTLMAGDLMRERRSHPIIVAAVLSVLGAVVALALVGALVLVHQGAQQQLCWSRPGTADTQGEASAVCDKLGALHAWWNERFAPSGGH